jgi:ABC-2 type transport system permease protein
MWIIAIGLVGPLLALAGINVTLMVSSRVSDPRTAEQVSMVLLLPLLGLFFAQIAGVLMVNVQVMELAAVIMVAVDVGLVYLGVRAFQRETILTKWK